MQTIVTTLLLLMLSVPTFTSSAYAEAHGQKHIDGVISGDQRSIGAYQGPPGTKLRRVVDVCNLGREQKTWPVQVRVEPPIATPEYAGGITVPAKDCVKYYFGLTINAGEGKQEAWAIVQIGSQLGPLERYVTRCPVGQQTCHARR